MSVSILEALQNAEINLGERTIGFQNTIGRTQLHNAITLLEKGYGIDEEVEPLLEANGGDVENIPDKS